MGIVAGRVKSIPGLPDFEVVSETSVLVRPHLIEASSLVFVRSFSDLGTSVSVASISLLNTWELRLDASSPVLGYRKRK